MSTLVADLGHITDGVFFRVPEPLPRGKHGLTRSEVTAAHRERLCIAVTELLAAGGYRRVGVKDVCARAQVSLAAFYACFDTKDEAIFAAYDRFIAVLLDRLTAVSGDDLHEYSGGLAGAYLGALASDLVSARAFQVEMDALGSPARERRREATSGLAALLAAKHAEFNPAAASRTRAGAYLAAVYAVRQLACDLIERGDAAGLEAMAGEIGAWAGRLFDGR